MFLRKYRYIVGALFMFIFMMKMGISGAPVFFANLDKDIMNAVIMQVELEHDKGSDSGKKAALIAEVKLIEVYLPILSYEFSSNHFFLKNSFIEHFKRYVDPYHPSVPTPPPNFV